ncbi:Proteasome subunit alpha type [Psidium guajava]|nr:Proteasome subunit alpha type [Psidium guajava]
MDEPGPEAVGAVDKDGVEWRVSPLESGEPTGKRVEMGEGGRESALELFQEGMDESGAVAEVGVRAARRKGEEEALLNLVAREHGEVPRRQVERVVGKRRKLWWFDETVGDESEELRSRSHRVGCVC